MNKKIGLFVTCLVDLFRPSVGFASIKLLEDAGFDVEIPPSQTCCGQPAFNNGDRDNSRDIAKQLIKTFEGYDYIVSPSGSCAGMLKKHYPPLFVNDREWHERAEHFSLKVHELVSFLTDVCGINEIDSSYEGTITYHDSCSGLRELGIYKQPRLLLNSIKGLTLKEMKASDECCGFGGTFCVKYSEISNRIVTDKCQHIEDTGAETLLAGDMGCLMNMAGKLHRQGHPIKVRHIAEILAGSTDSAPIGGTIDKK